MLLSIFLVYYLISCYICKTRLFENFPKKSCDIIWLIDVKLVLLHSLSGMIDIPEL